MRELVPTAALKVSKEKQARLPGSPRQIFSGREDKR
jgi:hypothetical protein